MNDCRFGVSPVTYPDPDPDGSLRNALAVNRMNSSFPNRWSFSYLKFTKYVTNIIAEPKYKYGQQEQVTVRNHNKSTALERSVLKYWGGGFNRFYGYPISPSASVMAQNIQLFGPREGFLAHQWIITGNK